MATGQGRLRRLRAATLILAGALAITGFGTDATDATCAEVRSSAVHRTELTTAVYERLERKDAAAATRSRDEELERIRLIAETYCSNSTDRSSDEPYDETVRVLGKVGAGQE